MKVFIHYEAIIKPQTFTIIITNDITISKLIELFIQKYNIKNEEKINNQIDRYIVRYINNYSELLLPYNAIVIDLVEDRSDLLVCNKDNCNNQVIVSIPSNSIIDIRNQVKNLFNEKKFKEARELITSYRKANNNKNDCILSFILSQIYFNNNLFDQSIESIEISIKLANDRTITSIDKYIIRLFYIQVLFTSGSFDEALIEINRLIDNLGGIEKVISSKDKALTVYLYQCLSYQAECYFELGNINRATDIINQSLSYPNADSDIYLLSSYTYFSLKYDKYEESVNALLKLLAVDRENKRTRQLISQALKSDITIDLIVKSIPPSIQSISLYNYLAVVAKDFSVLKASNRLMELSISVEMNLPKQLVISSDSSINWTNIYLTLAHNYELLFQYDKALVCITNYWDTHRNVTLGGSGDLSVTCGLLYDTLLSASNESKQSNGISRQAVVYSIDYSYTYDTTIYSSVDIPAILSDLLSSYLSNPSNYQLVNELKHKKSSNLIDQLTSHLINELVNYLTSTYLSNNLTIDGPIDRDIDNNEIARDNLAIAMLAVKILYLKGNLSILPSLVSVIESIRYNYLKHQMHLHESSIRNENAYYICISMCLSNRLSIYLTNYITNQLTNQISTSISNFLTNNSTNEVTCELFSGLTIPLAIYQQAFNDITNNLNNYQPIYLVGDSHILPLAWNVIRYTNNSNNNINRLLVPRLITGLKHWHLRSGSTFYPKAGFEQAVSMIPNGSEVIFVLGEIDCREGLLIAVEKDKYTNLTIAMRETCKNFTNTLKSLVNRKKYNAYVMPVLPTIPVTRNIALNYNTEYKNEINKIKGVKWIDVLGDILTDDLLDIKDTYKLDGIHIHPKFIYVLEKYFNK